MRRRVNSVREVSRCVVRDAAGTHEVDFSSNRRTTAIRRGLTKEDWYAIGLRIGLQRARMRNRVGPDEKHSNVSVIVNPAPCGIMLPLVGEVN
jgi:hypothetical protein